jgi:hypothetical protein
MPDKLFLQSDFQRREDNTVCRLWVSKGKAGFDLDIFDREWARLCSFEASSLKEIRHRLLTMESPDQIISGLFAAARDDMLEQLKPYLVPSMEEMDTVYGYDS